MLFTAACTLTDTPGSGVAARPGLPILLSMCVLDLQKAGVVQLNRPVAHSRDNSVCFAATLLPVRGEGIRSSSSLSELLLSDRSTPIARALAYASRKACSGV